MKKLIIDLAQLYGVQETLCVGSRRVKKRDYYGRTGWNGEKMQTFANILRRYRQVRSKKALIC